MNLRDDFNRRVVEIDLYFDILEALEFDKPKLVSYDVLIKTRKEIIFDSKKINILRSTTFLLLYNLIESTVFNSIADIFESIESNGFKYKDVILDIKKYWLDNIYKHDEKIKKESIINTFIKISDKIFNDSLKLMGNSIKYGGSLDAENINSIIRSLGCKSVTYRRDTHKIAFDGVKLQRNSLAHGEVTFSDAGQNYDYKRLLEWKLLVYEHLENFLKEIEDYVKNKNYLITPLI